MPVYINRLNELGVTSNSSGDTEKKIIPSVRRLELLQDAKMDWKQHISFICIRANSLM